MRETRWAEVTGFKAVKNSTTDDGLAVCVLRADGSRQASGTSGIGPGLRAASGGGVTGYFIPREEQCPKQACTWTGDFRLPDGTVLLVEAGIQDTTETGFRAGVPVPARDTGANYAFPPSDPGAWHDAAYALILGTWSWAVLLFLAVRPVFRRLHSRLLERAQSGQDPNRH